MGLRDSVTAVPRDSRRPLPRAGWPPCSLKGDLWLVRALRRSAVDREKGANPGWMYTFHVSSFPICQQGGFFIAPARVCVSTHLRA